MDKIMRYSLKSLIILALSILGGSVLMVLVFLFPVQEMKANAQRSTEIYDYEEVYPQLMWGYKMSQLDNCTDATMILNAIFSGTGNVVDDAMKIYRTEYYDRTPVGSLTDFANDVAAKTYNVSYPRYWHGYLVFIKPLLLLFDIADIRIWNMFLFYGLLIYIILLMQKKGLGNYIFPFGVSVLLLNPVAVPLSFQFSTVSYIMLFAVWTVLNKDDWKIENMFFFFMFLGIVTAYFDFLTFPLVGLYFPMIFLLLKENSWKNAMTIVILCSVAWMIGYAGMWSGKWLVGSILTGENFFADAFDRAGEYANMEYGDGKVNFLQVIWKNIQVLVKWPIVISGMGIVLWQGKNLLKAKKEHSLTVKWIFPFLLVAFAPIVWYIAAGTHSYIHYWFTYRELCVSIFAVLTGLWKVMD